MTHPSRSWTILIFDKREVAHEIFDLGVFGCKVVKATFRFVVAKCRDVGVFHVVSYSVSNRVDPFHFASEHLRQFVGLRIIMGISSANPMMQVDKLTDGISSFGVPASAWSSR